MAKYMTGLAWCLCGTLLLLTITETSTCYTKHGKTPSLNAPIKASTKDNLVKKSTIDEIDNSLAKLHVFLSKYSKRQAAKKRLFSRSFPSVNKLKKLYDKIVLERQLLQRGRDAKRRTLLNDSRLSLLAKIGKLFSVLALKKWRPGKLGQAELSRRQQQAAPLSFDLGFMVDGSNAIEEQGSGNFKKCLEFVKEVIHAFPISNRAVHAGLISYSEQAAVDFDFTSYYNTGMIDAALEVVPYPGSAPYTGYALQTAMQKLFPNSGRQNIPHVLVVISGSRSEDDFEPAAEELRASGVSIFCVGVGGRFDQSQLDSIASSPANEHVITAQFDGLRSVVPVMIDQIMKAVESGQEEKRREPVVHSLLTEGGVVEAKMDLGFLIDGSAVVGEQNFRASLDLTKNVYKAFWSQFRSVHMGLVVFGGSEPHVVFDFDRSFQNMQDIDKATDGVAYPGGGCHVGEALKAAKSNLFGSKHSDSYRRFLVTVIGGASEDDVFQPAEDLRVNSVTVLAVGAGGQVEREQLEGIASPPASQNILTADYSQLGNLAKPLVNKLEEGRTTFIPPENAKKPNVIPQLPATLEKQSPGQLYPGQTSPENVYPGLPYPGTIPQGHNRQPSPNAKPSAIPSLPGLGVGTGNVQIPGVPPVLGGPPGSAGTAIPPGNQPKRPRETYGWVPPGGKATPSKGTELPGLPQTPGIAPPGELPGEQPSGRPGLPDNFPPKPPAQGVPNSATVIQGQTQKGLAPIVPANQGTPTIVTNPGVNTIHPPFAPPSRIVRNVSGGPREPEVAPSTGQNTGQTPGTLGLNPEQTPGQTQGTQGSNPGQTPSTPETNPGQSPGTPGKSPGQTPGTPGNNSGETPGTLGNNPGQLPSTTGNNPGRTPGIPGTNTEQTPGTQEINAGQTPSIPGNNPGQTPDTLGNIPGQTPGTQGTNPGQTPGAPGNNPGQTPGTPGNNPGQKPGTPGINPGQTLGTPGANLGQTPSTPGNNSGQTPGIPGTNPGQTPGTQEINLGQTPSIPGNNLGQTPGPSGTNPGQTPGTSGGASPNSKPVETSPIAPRPMTGTRQPGSAEIAPVNGSTSGTIQPTVNPATTGTPGYTAIAPASGVITPTTGPAMNQVAPVTGARTQSMDQQLDLGFLIDGSKSMPPDAFTKSLTLVKAIYRNFPIGVYGTHVALAVYGVNTQIIFNFTALTSKVAVNGAVDKVKYPGSANTLLGKGLSNFKRSVFDTTTRPGARKVLVVFIAGVSQDNIDGPSREIRDNGAKIFVIGIGNAFDMSQLREVASSPTENHVTITSSVTLPHLLRPTVESIRQAFTEETAIVASTELEMELAFVLDVSSGTISPIHFRNIINSLKTVYKAFVIGPNKTRIGIIIYDKTSHVVIELFQGTSQVALRQKIDGIAQSLIQGPGALGEALISVKNYLFAGKTRPDTPKLLVVVTGWRPKDDVSGPSQDLKDTNTTIFTVGVGERADKETLSNIATSTPQEHVLTTDISSHDSAGENLASRIRRAVEVNLGFLADGSKNIHQQNFVALLDTAKYIYSAFPVSRLNVRVGMGIISSNPEIIFGFDKYFDKPNLDKAVSDIDYPGSGSAAHVGKALTAAKDLLFGAGARKRVRNVLVVLLGGKSVDDVTEAVRGLRDSKVEVFCVSIGNDLDSTYLGTIASVPTSLHGVVTDYNSLAEGALETIEKLEIAKVEYNQTQPPSAPVENKIGPIDLGILIEGSRNTIADDFDKGKEIAKAVYKSFPVAENGTHVAVAVYADGTKIVFDLNKYFNTEQMDSAIDATPLPGGLSNAGKAIDQVKKNIFDSGSRPGVQRVLVTIMTGKPDDDVKLPAQKLKDSCVLSFGLGLGTTYSKPDMEMIASKPPSEFSVMVEGPGDEKGVAKNIVEKINKALSIASAWNSVCAKREETRLDIAFLVDGCRHVTNLDYKKVLELVQTVYHSSPQAPEHTRVAIVVFANGIRTIQNFKPTIESSSIDAELKKQSYSGDRCSIGEGLVETKRLFDSEGRPGVPRVLVMLAAGRSDDDVTQSARALRKDGVLIYTVGLGPSSDHSTLRAVSSSPASEFVVQDTSFPVNSTAPRSVVEKILKALDIGSNHACEEKRCSRKNVTHPCVPPCPTPCPMPCSLPPCPNSMSPPVQIATSPCQAPQPYQLVQLQNVLTACQPSPSANLPCPPIISPPAAQPLSPRISPPQPRHPEAGKCTGNMTSQPLDLVFLIDGCHRINETLFRQVLEVVKFTYHRLPVSLEETNIGLAVYGQKTNVIMDLKRYYHPENMDLSVRLIKRPGGECLLGKALRAVKSYIFDTTGRPGENRTLLVFMCGKSEDDVKAPSAELKNVGVRIVTVGACTGTSEEELCDVSSPPRCQNAVMLRTTKPPDGPAAELADKVKNCVPRSLDNTTEPESPKNFTSPPDVGHVTSMVAVDTPDPQTLHPMIPVFPHHAHHHFGPLTSLLAHNSLSQQHLLPVGPESTLYEADCYDLDPECSAYSGHHDYCDGSAIGYSMEYLSTMCKRTCNLCSRLNDLTSLSAGPWMKRSRLARVLNDRREKRIDMKLKEKAAIQMGRKDSLLAASYTKKFANEPIIPIEENETLK